jgi:hypothetical protein
VKVYLIGNREELAMVNWDVLPKKGETITLHQQKYRVILINWIVSMEKPKKPKHCRKNCACDGEDDQCLCCCPSCSRLGYKPWLPARMKVEPKEPIKTYVEIHLKED